MRSLIQVGQSGNPAQVLLDLHAELWAMSPVETFGVLVVASAREDVFLPAAVRHHTEMTVAEALARWDKIVSYLASLGHNTDQLETATTEDAQVIAIVEAMGFTEQQLWTAME